MSEMIRESKLTCPICCREGLADMPAAKPQKTDQRDAWVVAVIEGFSIKHKTEVVCSPCQVSALRPTPKEGTM